DGERGDDDFAVVFQGAIDDGADAVVDVGERLVDAVAVSAFGDQVISVARNVVMAAAEVAGEGESHLAFGFFDVDHNHRGTEHVAGVQPRGCHTVGNG